MISSLTNIDWSYTWNVPVGQLWAQAYALFRKGEPWDLLPDEAKAASGINELYEIDDPLAEHFLNAYQVDPDKSWFTPTIEIIETLRNGGHLVGMADRSASMSLAGILTRFKVTKVQQREGERVLRGWQGVTRR